MLGSDIEKRPDRENKIMHLVIDANVICSYYKEEVLELDPPLTGPATSVINRLGHYDRAYLDNDGQIEHEWCETIDPEWFKPWLASLLIEGKVMQVEVDACRSLRDQLSKLDFPTRGSRDFWYIRTAKAVVDQVSEQLEHNPRSMTCIVSEDLDFYDPTQKRNARGDQRIEILLSGYGPIARYLRRREQICVCCVHNYLDMCES